MATATRTVRLKLTVASAPAQVYRAFSKGLALEEWLCDAARVEARPGGRLYLAWNNGFYGTGEYQRLEPGTRVSFSWRGKGDPESSRVQVSIKPQDDSTLVTLEHSGYGTGKKWPRPLQDLEHDWTVAFENLKSMLGTGQDLRFVRRRCQSRVGRSPQPRRNGGRPHRWGGRRNGRAGGGSPIERRAGWRWEQEGARLAIAVELASARARRRRGEGDVLSRSREKNRKNDAVAARST
jgi:uncharacterized protein YndB with AHSA1/START domain